MWKLWIFLTMFMLIQTLNVVIKFTLSYLILNLFLISYQFIYHNIIVCAAIKNFLKLLLNIIFCLRSQIMFCLSLFCYLYNIRSTYNAKPAIILFIYLFHHDNIMCYIAKWYNYNSSIILSSSPTWFWIFIYNSSI